MQRRTFKDTGETAGNEALKTVSICTSQSLAKLPRLGAATAVAEVVRVSSVRLSIDRGPLVMLPAIVYCSV